MRTYLKRYKSVCQNTIGNNYDDFRQTLRNLERNLAIEFLERYLNGTEEKYLAMSKIKEILKNYSEKTFGIFKPFLNKRTPMYWRQRGFSEKEAFLIIKELKFKNPIKLVSPFSKEFWINKGMSESEAIFKANSIRPIRKEYWLVRGFDEETSIKMALDRKNLNNNNGKSSKNQLQPYHKEYWIIRGFDNKEAEEKVKERQSTFSLEKCILKQGLEEGTKIWKARQEKWQETLNNKSETEKLKINSNKNIFKLGEEESLEEYFKRIKDMNSPVFSKYETSKDIILKRANDYKTHHTFRHIFSPSEYIKTLPECEQKFIDVILFESETISYFEKLDFIKTGIGTMHMTPHGVLRSWNEIKFYYRLMSYNIEFELEKGYPNSRKRCDFFIPEFNEYIEIAGMMEIEEYRDLMKYKEETFGALILEFSDFDNYFKGLECKLN